MAVVWVGGWCVAAAVAVVWVGGCLHVCKLTWGRTSGANWGVELRRLVGWVAGWVAGWRCLSSCVFTCCIAHPPRGEHPCPLLTAAAAAAAAAPPLPLQTRVAKLPKSVLKARAHKSTSEIPLDLLLTGGWAGCLAWLAGWLGGLEWLAAWLGSWQSAVQGSTADETAAACGCHTALPPGLWMCPAALLLIV